MSFATGTNIRLWLSNLSTTAGNAFAAAFAPYTLATFTWIEVFHFLTLSEILSFYL
jgi:hypothetical protein